MGASSRMLYVKRTHPHTVHELDCEALDTMVVDASGQHKRALDNYDKVKAADVPIAWARSKGHFRG